MSGKVSSKHKAGKATDLPVVVMLFDLYITVTVSLVTLFRFDSKSQKFIWKIYHLQLAICWSCPLSSKKGNYVGAPIYLAAILDYLVTDILKLAGNAMPRKVSIKSKTGGVQCLLKECKNYAGAPVYLAAILDYLTLQKLPVG